MVLLTVFVGIIAFSSLVLLVGLATLAVSIKRLIDTSVKPAISNVNTLVDKVENRAERIMEISEDTVRKVSGKAVAAADMVEDTVTTPLISLSSLVAGISKAVQTWRQASIRS